MSLLSDTQWVDTLKKESTHSYKQNIFEGLQQLDKDLDHGQELYPVEHTPHIYSLPRSHQQGVPLRPTISSIIAITSPNTWPPSWLLWSGDLNTTLRTARVDETRTLKLDPGDGAVTSQFTCIPTSDSYHSEQMCEPGQEALGQEDGTQPAQSTSRCGSPGWRSRPDRWSRVATGASPAF